MPKCRNWNFTASHLLCSKALWDHAYHHSSIMARLFTHSILYIQNCTCMELVSLSARIHFKTSIFWKSSKSVFQCPGSGSLCGSTLSNIFLNPLVCSLNSSANFAKVGRAGSVRMSFQTLSEIQSGAGLASLLGIVVPPAIRWRHSSSSVSMTK